RLARRPFARARRGIAARGLDARRPAARRARARLAPLPSAPRSCERDALLGAARAHHLGRAPPGVTMNVLLLNQYFHPDLAPTAQLASDLAVALAERGHQVRAIASARPYAGAGWRALAEEHRGVRITRVPATALGRASRAARLIDYASFLAGAGPALAAGPRPD